MPQYLKTTAQFSLVLKSHFSTTSMLNFSATLLSGSRVSVPSPIRNELRKNNFPIVWKLSGFCSHQKVFLPCVCVYTYSLHMTSQRVRFSSQRVFRCPLTTDRSDISKAWEIESIEKNRNLPNHHKLLSLLTGWSHKDSPLAAGSPASLPIVHRTEVRGNGFQSPQNKVQGLSIFFHRITIKLEYLNKILRKVDFTEPDRIDSLYLLLPNHNGSIFSLN